MRNFARRSGAVLAYAALFTAAVPVEAVEVSGRVDIEPRVVLHSPEHSFQNHHGISLAIEPEFYFLFQNDRQSLVFTPFLRVDSADGRRSHFDLRELTYQWVFDDLELRAGIGRVFWGVTESYSLVDVINQTDMIEDVDLKEKLGQPMVNLTLIRDWGALDFFAMPGFRERTYPGRTGRLRASHTSIRAAPRMNRELGETTLTSRCGGRMRSGILTSAWRTSGVRAGSQRYLSMRSRARNFHKTPNAELFGYLIPNQINNVPRTKIEHHAV